MTNQLCWPKSIDEKLFQIAIINFLGYFFVYGPFSYFGIKYLVVWHLWNILYEIFMKLVGDMTMTGWLLRPPHFSDPTDPVHIKQQGDHVVLQSLSIHVHWRGANNFLYVKVLFVCPKQRRPQHQYIACMYFSSKWSLLMRTQKCIGLKVSKTISHWPLISGYRVQCLYLKLV